MPTPCSGGSIPAGAGEPKIIAQQCRARMVDPRGCGGASSRSPLTPVVRGRSPRVRGSHHQRDQHGGGFRSIPAGAGEPIPRSAQMRQRGVDPRGCGGAASVAHASPFVSGRSPRVRGSHYPHGWGWGRGGSIPAGAGEPRRHDRAGHRLWVDPRGCGGAGLTCAPCWRAMGRSPRVRGSLTAPGQSYEMRGSIPAGAGEPAAWRPGSSRRRVDPRGCGGAVIREAEEMLSEGRSPRVRGSPDPAREGRQVRGSIPAGAGEPAPAATCWSGRWVDPRGCGGATVKVRQIASGLGRSPRVRGSHRRRDFRDSHHGSIPAGAGEPLRDGFLAGARGVDPRGCGGAPGPTLVQPIHGGRSPRVRGSQP